MRRQQSRQSYNGRSDGLPEGSLSSSVQSRCTLTDKYGTHRWPRRRAGRMLPPPRAPNPPATPSLGTGLGFIALAPSSTVIRFSLSSSCALKVAINCASCTREGHSAASQHNSTAVKYIKSEYGLGWTPTAANQSAILHTHMYVSYLVSQSTHLTQPLT